MNKTKINAVIVGDSICPRGHRITTFIVTFPRIVLAEFNTHRMFSRNAASSRAIPLGSMIKSIEENPFIPIAWQQDHKGMQGTEYLDGIEMESAVDNWLLARDSAVAEAEYLSNNNVTKQLCNRLLEPFMWHTVIITATEWENFFALRCPQYQLELEEGDNGKRYIEGRSKKDFIKEFLKTYPTHGQKELVEDYNLVDNEELMTPNNSIGWFQLNKGKAEIHLMELAECMWNVRNESKPKELKIGDWHIPFEDKMEIPAIQNTIKWGGYDPNNPPPDSLLYERIEEQMVKISTAMAARTSYTVVGNEKELNYENLIALHDRLISQVPLHASPMEHCAKVPTDKEYYYNVKGEGFDTHDDALGFHTESYGWFDNFHGFIPYRKLLEK